MNLTASDLEMTGDVVLEMLVNNYTETLGAVYILSYIWNYLRWFGIDGHRKFLQVVKEQLQAKYVSQGCKGIKY